MLYFGIRRRLKAQRKRKKYLICIVCSARRRGAVYFDFAVAKARSNAFCGGNHFAAKIAAGNNARRKAQRCVYGFMRRFSDAERQEPSVHPQYRSR